MIFDCFLFSNELEVLEVRLNELYDVVDRFVLVESNRTHTNRIKKLFYKENKNRFKKFNNKIIHVVVNNTPNVSLPWIINDFQFSQINRGLSSCLPNDVIIFGDVDEIPRSKKIVENLKNSNNLLVFSQSLYEYYFNYMEVSGAPWYGTRMIKYKYFSKYYSPWVAKFSYPEEIVLDGGWHFSYIGNIEKIQEKIYNQAHQEFNNLRYNTPEKIKLAIREGRDLYGLGMRFMPVGLENLPSYVKSNPYKFRKFIISSKKNYFYNLDLHTLIILRNIVRKIKKHG